MRIPRVYVITILLLTLSAFCSGVITVERFDLFLLEAELYIDSIPNISMQLRRRFALELAVEYARQYTVLDNKDHLGVFEVEMLYHQSQVWIEKFLLRKYELHLDSDSDYFSSDID